MEFAQIVKGTTYYLETFVTDKYGSGKAGLSVTYEIRKSSDNSLVTSGTMIDIGGGIYQKSFPFNDLGQYRVRYITPTNYEDGIASIFVVEEISADLSGVHAKLDRILGLCHENMTITNARYDNKGNLIDGTLKIYASAIDCEQEINAIAEYDISASHDTKGLMLRYKCKKV